MYNAAACLNAKHVRLQHQENKRDTATLFINITINTVILAAQEIIYRNRQIGGTLALAQVRQKHYNQMIKEHSLAKFSSDQHNFHNKWDSIEDDLISYKFPTD